MKVPFNYDPKTASIAYLKRVYVRDTPKRITICAMLGSTYTETIDMQDEIADLLGPDRDDTVRRAIKKDYGTPPHLLYGEVKAYMLVIQRVVIATYDARGEFMMTAPIEPLYPVECSAEIDGKFVQILQSKEDQGGKDE
ncbi:hypothetical protein [Pseudidiomarina taiwanensis]|uniref:Uncharacterized protein n=1 Tax=Pseudidiomarina taiwanensis TaxID=337250 RepID=A0A432ZFF8_9GAMM|nr:hypothetical protein [Pseudidiomarina taiwanensis]RUO76639.1 hypothetical protein CWI83_06830 [Pseudidiomarina taiwanensis]